MKKNLLVWIGVLLLLTIIPRGCSKNQNNLDQLKTGDLSLLTTQTYYNRGKDVSVYLQNNTAKDIAISNPCPKPPFDIYFYQNNDWAKLEPTAELNCQKIPPELSLKPQKKIQFNLASWKHNLFSDLGRYQIKLTFADKTYLSNEFTIGEETLVQLIWQQAFYRPIYNVLIFFITITPARSLGLAIILLTILIRLILLIPSQKALRSQKKLQEVQPKLQAIQKKYKGQQDKIAAETMKIWKEHKVNPFGSCLPILLQFPVMIALFYVVRDGINPDNIYLLYPPLQDFSLKTINTNFLGILELTNVNAVILPLIIGGLQFFQMKLSFVAKKGEPPKQEKTPEADQMQMMNKTMTYFMPVMIAVFTASVPAGVGLYWGISTLFGIGQQIFVNREKIKNKPKVEVIESK